MTNATELISKEIAETKDWRGEMCQRLRELIHEADPDISEDWKWNSAIYVHDGLICAVSPFKAHVGVNFFKGAALADPDKLFNSGLDAKTMRTIKFFEGDKVNEAAFKKLIQAAVENNIEKEKK
jgi:hypothetical protein